MTVSAQTTLPYSFEEKESLVKCWIETMIGQTLPSKELHDCLKDGTILSRIAQCLFHHRDNPFNPKDNHPKAHIEFFLERARDFGLQPEELFDVDDLMDGENMNAVTTTLLLLSHLYQQRSTTLSLLTAIHSPTEAPRHLASVDPNDTLERTTHIYREKREESDLGFDLDNWSFSHSKHDLSLTDYSTLSNRPPYDIERPNCVPGIGPFSLSDFKNDSELHKDTDPPVHNMHDLFESLLVPVQQTPPSLRLHPPSSQSSSSKLSLLFKKRSRDPHFVKYQTWQHREEQMTWMHFLKQDPGDRSSLSSTVVSNKNRPRSSTEASIIEVAPPLLTRHTRCQSTDSSPTLVSSRKSFCSLEPEGLALLDPSGQLLARYKLGNVIGKGHFGTVYRALDLISGKTVAIKQVSLKDARKSDVEDMMQEASLLSALTHPNIVKYEGFIQTEEHVHIVLEFVENGSLLHTLKHFGGALPEHLVAGYCYDILQGLIYLHQQDVVHCDLKAANILTTKTGHVKLSDFGVSLSLEIKAKGDNNLVSGTPFWMSPEVIELKGASVQSDIWSLGCTLIELCTGKPPYADCIAMTAMYKIVEDECPPLPPNASNDLLDFLKLCFKKNPVERPKAIHLVHHPWITQHRTYRESVKSQPIHHTYPMPSKSSTYSHSMPLTQKKKRASSLSRQSMPILQLDHHSHTLIECSFPKGVGQCKQCHMTIKNEALVCHDFCGFVCHKQCNPKPTMPLLDKLSLSNKEDVSFRTTKWWRKK